MRKLVTGLLGVAAALTIAAGLALPAAASSGARTPPAGVHYTGNTALIRVAHPVDAPRTQLPHVRSTSLHVKNSTLVQTSNWSGYAVNACGTCAQRFVDVQFTTPSVNCTGVTTSNPTFASFWAGLDGLSSSTVEQTGVLAQCNGTTPEYYAWYEMFPLAPVYFSITGFGPGDAVDVSVYHDFGGGLYHLAFNDLTQGTGFATAQPCPPGSTCNSDSAEVIAEAPSSGSTVLPLADYGAVFFTGAHLTFRNGNHYNFENDPIGASYAIQMVNGPDTLAKVGTLSDGFGGTLPVSAFQDFWHASA